MTRRILSICLCIFAALIVDAQQFADTHMIWAGASHNAFTSLTVYHDNLYLSFREAQSHVDRNGGDNGVIRILKSQDGKRWRSVGRIKMKGYDLRDPQIQTLPDGKLMVSFVAATYKNGRANSYHTYMSELSNDRILRPVRLQTLLPSDWLWRIHWNKNIAYSFNYINSFNLLSSRDGINYNVVRDYDIPGKASETDFVINGDSVFAVARNDKAMGMLGYGTLSDGHIRWQRMDKNILAPCLIKVDANTILLLVTELSSSRELKVYKVKGSSLDLVTTLPSKGDCGYMGAAVFRNRLFISYYSTIKDEKTAVFMTTVPLGFVTRN